MEAISLSHQQRIRVRGTVQGVGFRPTAYRLAVQYDLSGEIFNDSEGVCILVGGSRARIEKFLRRLVSEAPPLAHIESIDCDDYHGSLQPGFRIVQSRPGLAFTAVTADAATCSRCLTEIFDPTNRRYEYPFTNCTHCGPRLSITQAVPYDRCLTSMSEFPMCAECEGEFKDPCNRRFHAQPNACAACGPRVWLEDFAGRPVDAAGVTWHEQAAALLKKGTILAVKGIGGFHLACDAGNDAAVARLRRRKRRYEKPFALMARDIAMVASYCRVSTADRAMLESTAAPIVIMPCRKPAGLADAVAPNQSTYGFMLPYTPLHHLILQHLAMPIVLTSGNVSEEPQCLTNVEAREKLGGIAEYLLLHNREIEHRLDDSVARTIGHSPRLLRRARGFAPAPIPLPEGFGESPVILAFGGELKNTFCLLREGQAVLSQHLGNVEDKGAYDAYTEAISRYQALFRCSPSALAADLHPEYLPSKLARRQARMANAPFIEVQHHHAHLAACMVENGIPRHAPPVLGIALDGLGYGDDGTLWGGEFLLADYRHYRRLGAFQTVPMPGGSRAIVEPWRMACAYLCHTGQWSEWAKRYRALPFFHLVAHKPVPVLRQAMRKNINCPGTSACGRLFDAVASITGLRHEVTYEAQGAIELEAAIDSLEEQESVEPYPFRLDTEGSIATLSTAPLWPPLLEDLAEERPVSDVSARFHQGLARAVREMVHHLDERYGALWQGRIALSGGVFQNRVLAERLNRDLTDDGYRVYTHRRIPTNDGGLSVGQAAVAAAILLSQTR